MITIPIRITLSPGRLVFPRDQNTPLTRFACPTCGQHLSATCDQIGMTAPCPICNGVVTVPIHSTLPPRPLPLPEPQKPRKTATWGGGLQVIGFLLCWSVVGGAIVGIPLRWTVVGAIVGIALLIVGRRMATRTFICQCGNEMTKDTKICPTCEAQFP
jgi:predicted RNA-binding Zn-ribbon protein involved in translation (DUF1610 family)